MTKVFLFTNSNLLYFNASFIINSWYTNRGKKSANELGVVGLCIAADGYNVEIQLSGPGSDVVEFKHKHSSGSAVARRELPARRGSMEKWYHNFIVRG